MTLVLGIDSSTQSTKAVLVDASDGSVVEQRSAPHPDGTEIDPRAWTSALETAAGPLLPRAAAVSVAGQQHGMVALDERDHPVRPALLWNDTRSASAARQLVEEWGGPQACADLVGSVLVASFTVTKLRWLRDHEPDAARRTKRVLLPHDHLSRFLAAPGTAPYTDRGDASGTGYFSTREDRWRPDLAASALGHEVHLPRVVPPGEVAAETATGQALGAGTGDNMAAALALDLEPGDVLLSVGTSGVAAARTRGPVLDGSGLVTGFADATGGFLPLAVTLNAARILDLQARLLGVDHDELADLALSAPPGSHGATLLPYYGGERTPDRPHAVGTWTGLTTTTDRADLARAAFEALACSLADTIDALAAQLDRPVGRIVLVGGATRSRALQQVLPAVLGRAVELPPPGEYVAHGAARQAAWALSGAGTPPDWPTTGSRTLTAEPTPEVREAYALLREQTSSWS